MRVKEVMTRGVECTHPEAPLRNAAEKMKALDDLIPHDLVIPRGTPLNLILNLNAARAPYALKFYLKNKADERRVVEELLKLSDCPDLVENRGHTYGSELKPSEKRDLIEFLKTL